MDLTNYPINPIEHFTMIEETSVDDNKRFHNEVSNNLYYQNYVYKEEPDSTDSDENVMYYHQQDEYGHNFSSENEIKDGLITQYHVNSANQGYETKASNDSNLNYYVQYRDCDVETESAYENNVLRRDSCMYFHQLTGSVNTALKEYENVPLSEFGIHYYSESEENQLYMNRRENYTEENNNLHVDCDQTEVDVDNMYKNYETISSFNDDLSYNLETPVHNNDYIFMNSIDNGETHVDEVKNEEFADETHEDCHRIFCDDEGVTSIDNDLSSNFDKQESYRNKHVSSHDEELICNLGSNEIDSCSHIIKQEICSDAQDYYENNKSCDEEHSNPQSEDRNENYNNTNAVDADEIPEDDRWKMYFTIKEVYVDQAHQYFEDIFPCESEGSCDLELRKSDEFYDFPRETDCARRERMHQKRCSRYKDKSLSLTPTRGRNINAPPKKIFLMGPKRLFL